MSLTFRKFSASARLSQESTAYDTQVLFDGTPIGTCSNEGRGGMGHFRPAAGVDADRVQQAEEWARQQPVQEADGSPMVYEGRVVHHEGIADYCDSLADRTLEEARLRRTLKRLLKSKVVFTNEKAKGPGVFQINCPWTKEFEPEFRKRYPDAIVLNELPFEAAMEAFDRHTRPAPPAPSPKAPKI